jgi:hypothetical protein
MKTKLVMVSTWFHGRRQTAFIQVPIQADGKQRISVKVFEREIAHISNHETFIFGG